MQTLYLIVSLFFCFLIIIVYIRNPLILCLYLVLMATLLRIVMYSEISVWFFNALILIFLGGMIILFLYLSTLSNNMKFVFPFFRFGSAILISSRLIVFYNLNISVLGVKLESLVYTYSSVESVRGSSVLFYVIKIPHLTFLVTLLLLTLFTVIKLTESFKGSLVKRQKN